MVEIKEYVEGLTKKEIQERIGKIIHLCNRLTPDEDSFIRVNRRYTVSLKKYCKVLESELSRRG